MSCEPSQIDDLKHSTADKSLPLNKLQSAVANLKPLCRPLSQITEQFILAFNTNQFDAVNRMWQEQGLDLVISRFGHLLRYHISKVEDLPQIQKNTEDSIALVQYDIPENLRLLQVFKYEPAKDHNTQQNQYFRTANIKLDQVTEQEALNIIKRSQLLELIVPEQDEVQNNQLRGNNILGLQVVVHSYGKENWYGNGVTLRLSLEVSRPERSNIDARLFLTEQSNITTCLFDPELAETGYEGHQFCNVQLSPEQIQILTTLVEKFMKCGAQENKPHYVAMWLGNSLTIQSEYF